MSRRPSIYLAGPITGLSYGDARHGWREEFFRLIGGHASAIDCFSPMRAKEFLRNHAQISGSSNDAIYSSEHALARPLGIVTRDFNDVSQRDAIVANFLGAERVSIGTVWEIGAAFALRKPVIVVMEPKGNVHDHIFVTHSTGYVVPTLEEAALIAQSILMAGV